MTTHINADECEPIPRTRHYLWPLRRGLSGDGRQLPSALAGMGHARDGETPTIARAPGKVLAAPDALRPRPWYAGLSRARTLRTARMRRARQAGEMLGQ